MNSAVLIFLVVFIFIIIILVVGFLTDWFGLKTNKIINKNEFKNFNPSFFTNDNQSLEDTLDISHNKTNNLPQTPTDTPNNPSFKGSCGSRNNNQKCEDGFCCSELGFCGNTSVDCTESANSVFNGINTIAISKDNKCGKLVNKRCPDNLCCSSEGLCGRGTDFCVQNENTEFNAENARLERQINDIEYNSNSPTYLWNQKSKDFSNKSVPVNTGASDWLCSFFKYDPDFVSFTYAAFTSPDNIPRVPLLGSVNSSNKCSASYKGIEEISNGYDVLIPLNSTTTWNNKNDPTTDEKVRFLRNINASPLVCRVKINENPETWKGGREVDDKCYYGLNGREITEPTNFQYLTIKKNI